MRNMLAAVAIAAVAAIAGPALAEIKTKEIEYKHGDVTLQGFLAYDDAVQGKRPGVIVFHEWWGMDNYARSRARQLAELGYVAFAADMYGRGVTADTAQQAGQLAGKLDSDRALLRERAAAGLNVLTDQPQTDASRLGAIGYCMGGKVALELARSGADLDAVVSFHGSLGTPMPAKAGTFKPMVLIANGADDTFVSEEEKEKFYAEMNAAKVDFMFVDYAGAVHSFTNPGADKHGIPGVKYNEKADRRSWAGMRQVFDEAFGAAR